MNIERSVLTPAAARDFYDRFGEKADAQSFYEDPPLDVLIAHAGFEDAGSVFEFGCGTGRLAARLLSCHLPASATYLGVDLSPTMIGLAARRLAPYAERARVVLADGTISFPLPEHSVDFVISAYVLDLLSEQDTRSFIAEAYRVLKPSGKLCLASLTSGITWASRLVSWLWLGAFRARASLVGGCRPIRIEAYVDDERWQVRYHHVSTPFAIPSAVLVLQRNPL